MKAQRPLTTVIRHSLTSWPTCYSRLDKLSNSLDQSPLLADKLLWRQCMQKAIDPNHIWRMAPTNLFWYLVFTDIYNSFLQQFQCVSKPSASTIPMIYYYHNVLYNMSTPFRERERWELRLPETVIQDQRKSHQDRDNSKKNHGRQDNIRQAPRRNQG